MYIEYKDDGLRGSVRIGRVSFSRTGTTIYYAGKSFGKIGGRGFKANYMKPCPCYKARILVCEIRRGNAVRKIGRG